MESPTREEPRDETPRSMEGAWPLLVGITLLVAVTLLVDPIPAGIWHDDGVYVLLGKSLAEGHGLTYQGVLGAPVAPKFPPLYPLVLAAAWWSSPEFPGNAGLFQVISLLFVAGAGMVFYGLQRRVLGVPDYWAGLSTLLLWGSPDLWRFALIPLSEPLFTLALLLGLWGAIRAERELSARTGLGAVIGYAVAFHVRSVGLALGVGLVCALASRRRWREASWVGGGVLAVTLPWMLWSRMASQTIAPELRDILGSYGGWWTDRVDGLAALPTFLVSGFQSTTAFATGMMLPAGPGWLRWLGGGALLLVMGYGVRSLWSGSRTLIFCLVCFLAVVALWPFRDARLLVPALPLFGLLASEGARAALHRVREGGRFARVPVAIALVWALWFAGGSLGRWQEGQHRAGFQRRTRALADASIAIRRHVPPTGVVGAPEMWAGLHLSTGRTVIPSAPFLGATRDAPAWGTPEDQLELWRGEGMDYLLVEHAGRVHGATLDRLEATCPGTVRVLERLDGALLVTVQGWELCFP